MANSRENEIPHQVARCRIPWKLLPECLRRKGDRSFAKKKKEREEIVSVSAVMLSPVSPGCEDTGEHKKDETELSRAVLGLIFVIIQSRPDLTVD